MTGEKDKRSRIVVVRGDIVEADVDIVVNAANSALSGGGGVDGAIHRKAGPDLLKACLSLGRCPAGSAVITQGFNLKAGHVIHAVGPVWRGGDHDEDATLESCYRTALELAVQAGGKTIAFPAISCGAHKFPIARAARIAIDVVVEHLQTNVLPEMVTFICFDDQTERQFSRALSRVGQ